MDPVTAAILAAIATGLTRGVTKIGENVVADAYNALKSMLRRKFGNDKKLNRAIKNLEDQPNSKIYRQALEENFASKQVEHDTELLRLAEKLLTVSRQVTNVQMQAGDHATQMFGTGVGSIGTLQGNVFINQAPAMPGANELLQHGVKMIRAGAYDESIPPLNQSLLATPSSDANYYLALATLRGKRPRTLTYSQAKTIEEKLQAACRLNPHKAHYWYFLALVKYDFFLENGFLDDSDEIDDILFTGDACLLERAFVIELLNHVPAKNCPVYEIIQSRL